MKRRLLGTLLLLTLACIPKLCFATEGFFSLSEGKPLFSGNPWFDFKLSQVETALKNAGYNEDPMNMIYRNFGVLIYENSYVSPHAITLLCENNMVTSASLTHKGDSSVIGYIETTISEAAGKPTHTQEYTEDFGSHSETHGESLTWAYNGYSYKINGDGNRTKLSTISQIRNDSHPFILTVQRDEGSSKVQEKIEDVKPVVGMQVSTQTTDKETDSSLNSQLEEFQKQLNDAGSLIRKEKDTKKYTHSEEEVWQYCMDRWAYYDDLAGGYSGDKYTKQVFKDAGKKFRIPSSEAERIWNKVDRSKCGLD